MLHKCLLDEPLVSEISISQPLPCLEIVDPIPSMLRKLFGLTNGLSTSEAASFYLMWHIGYKSHNGNIFQA